VNAPSFDPEAISVRAEPKTVQEYLRFEAWINGLQSELDTSWAILGEVYGRFTQEALDKLQIRVRRLRSNVEDKIALQRRVNFVPERIHFSVSEPELLKLLMEPLYGDNPLYGLRELTQNAADSIIELSHLKRGPGGEHRETATEANIEIELIEAPDWCFIISDCGTGMTLPTIKNYFLKAGASFRNSELWKQNFLDEQGKSLIARTGRFGVGVLSAYLIGEKIEVYSRHFSDTSGLGYRFEAKIDEDEIEVTRTTGPIGTRIKIWSTEKKIAKIKLYLSQSRRAPFYYLRDRPSLSVTGEQSNGEGDSRKTKPHSRWIRANVSKYKDVHWERTIHEGGSPPRMGYLYCNGIVVSDLVKPSTGLLFNNASQRQPLLIQMPNVLVTDYDASLPLDLARKSLAAKDDELAEGVMSSICEQFFSELFSCPARTPSDIWKWWSNEPRLISSYEWNPFLFGPKGFSLLDPTLLQAISPQTFIVQNTFSQTIDTLISQQILDNGVWCAARRQYGMSDTDSLNLLRDGSSHKFPSFRGGRSSYRLCYVVQEGTAKRIKGMASVSNYIQSMIAARITFSYENAEYCVLNRSADKRTVDSVVTFAKEALAKNANAREWRNPLTIFSFESPLSNSEQTIISKVWNNMFSGPYLPYDEDERRTVLK
jgi:hypothetical protein